MNIATDIENFTPYVTEGKHMNLFVRWAYFVMICRPRPESLFISRAD